jgi:hypothetical protein|tara:strand:+ start:475 stop:1863 length:1389 start_codon:yes stop_codon:yes gene_type:complete
MPSINSFLKGFQDGLPGMKDYQHASRLYIDDHHKLAPKHKFLYHVVFDLDDTVSMNSFTEAERRELNMLVKAVDLPRYNMNYEEKVQYNKKMYTNTRIVYDPINITFHDDHADTVNAFWKKYYEYEVADAVQLTGSIQEVSKDDYYNTDRTYTKWGLDTPKQRKKPFIRSITIYVLHNQRFTSFRLVNPVIGSFSHDNLDQAEGQGVLQNQMQILYETVRYSSGLVKRGRAGSGIPGFATLHYDNEPSPLSVLGGGTNSLFGPGGVVDGIGSVIRNVQSGNILGAILGASNTYNNAKKIKKGDVKEELKGIGKDVVKDFGKQAGTITNPVAAFAVGTVLAAGTIASAKGSSDNKSSQNITVITNPSQDTVNYLSADEAYNLVTNNTEARDQVAAGIYYKDIGSRKGLTVAESDIEYAASIDNVKTVYTSKVFTDIRKLVTEGYLKINRTTQDVAIATEKVGL